MNQARIGVICSVGLEELRPEGKDLRIGTPYGPSPIIRLASVGDVDAAFLLRRGARQSQPPSRINYHANIWGFHELGVERIIGTDVVQIIDRSPRKSELAVPSDIIDLTCHRNSTFYDEAPVGQTSLEYPFCPEVRSILLNSGRRLGIEPEERSVYVCVDGPRFRTPAEIQALRILGGNLVGMTLAPEVFLARELGMCYAAIAVLFDEKGIGDHSPSAVRLIEAAKRSSKVVRDIITMTIREMPVRRKCPCSRVLEGTLV